MATTKTNPLDTFVSPTVPGTLKLPPLPNLGELITTTDFKSGHARYHELMTQWLHQVEELLNERLQSKVTVQAGKVQ